MSSPQDVFARLQRAYRSNKTRSYQWRITQLKALKRLVQENEDVMAAALNKDLGRGDFEARVLDLLPVIAECNHIINELDVWMRPESVRVPSLMLPATAEVAKDPLGVVLILSPFNYPLQLALSPLMGALSAGNCVVLKPSEISCACERLLAELIPKYLDSDCIAVVCGGVSVAASLLSADIKWDKIFFTGSTRVGKIVLKAAAENLTPVLLELGGKSPTIIDESVEDLKLAARRVVWGKFANAGQTCIAPDYVLVHVKHHDDFVRLCGETLAEFYGADPKSSPDFARIVNKASTQRLLDLLAEKGVGNAVVGGKGCAEDCYVAPTLVTDVNPDSRLLSEEIFGPILPIVRYNSLEDAIGLVRKHEKPLALYIFAKSPFNIAKLTTSIPSGGVVVNDTLMHCANPFLPFGGVGHSGLGAYHGKYSFESFSHARATLRKDDHTLLDVTARYPPFGKLKYTILRWGFAVPPLPLLREWVFPAICCAATWSLARYYYSPP